MTSPIFDFIKKYNDSGATRLHMPGHKGKTLLGCEHLDITEISGADSLFEASGIIAESERNASDLFGADTFYSTEGSSHCIRAAVLLLKLFGCKKIFASRNAHKSFISACALNGIEPIWLYPSDKSFLSGRIDAKTVEDAIFCETEKCAVFLTSPDYLGNICDISAVSAVCKKNGSLLFVDNAHGAYLKFLPKSKHPIDLGADMCCDSAHKTLPVLTGGAYLHISKCAPDLLKSNAKNALSLFGSTSPSYLIMQSLDMCNKYISDGYNRRLADFVIETEALKKELKEYGYQVFSNEPIKITIA
ncbi:MAG: aminotransferase class I/II-fold pyridoxal phosphate-dependent enzyme, partial [Clostridia bacterium]|nr:aminotransferase class I/II-fold pyridoxal phosphate-dependent enzyme [Clostridia bacterium]